MPRLLDRVVNWLVRGVTVEHMRVRDLHVGDHSTVLSGDYIEFDNLGADPAVAATGKARLCAASGKLRVSHATAYADVGSGGGGAATSDAAGAGVAALVGTVSIPHPTAQAGVAALTGGATATPTAAGSAALL